MKTVTYTCDRCKTVIETKKLPVWNVGIRPNTLTDWLFVGHWCHPCTTEAGLTGKLEPVPQRKIEQPKTENPSC